LPPAKTTLIPAFLDAIPISPPRARGPTPSRKSVDEIRKLAPNGGAYVSESNYFERSFGEAYWGSNYARLKEVKKKYDPDGLFFVHNGIGEWSADGFTRLK
jgi:FAD/FMN-containing dehydrogenase